MVNYSLPLYKHPRETWTASKCAKIAKTATKNGYGDSDPYPGLVSYTGSAYPSYGQSMRYNGGCVRKGKWYQGEEIPLPKIPKSFEFVTIPTWGIQLRKVN